MLSQKPSDFLVWLQTTVRRDPERTIQSIERSDIGSRFVVVTDNKQRKFPADYQDLQDWWAQSWLDMAEAARVRRCKWILRLEDDVLVNRHILHNLCHWNALGSSQFGLGTLFVPDYWLRRPELFSKCPLTGATYRNVKDVEGAQGQVIFTELVPQLIEGVPRARQARGLARPDHQPSFDWSLSRAAWHYGLKTYVHIPALVNIHEGSRSSKIDYKQHLTGTPHPECQHYWGGKSFKPDWQATRETGSGGSWPARTG